MNDINKSLRDAYYTALSSITFDGSAVKVYEVMPQNAGFPAILLSLQTDTDNSCKTNFGHDTTILIEVWNDYAGDFGTKDAVDNIGDDILNIVIGTGLDLLPSYKVVTSTLDNSTYLEENLDSVYRIRKQLRIRHQIEEL